MKRTIILGFAAFLFATGSAFVSKDLTNPPPTTLYQILPGSPNQCVESTCSLVMGNPCLTQSYTIKLNANACDNPVKSFRAN